MLGQLPERDPVAVDGNWFLKLKKVKVDDLSKYLRQRLYGGNRYTVATAIRWQRLYGDNHYTAGRKAK